MEKLRVSLAVCVVGGLIAASVLPVGRLAGDPSNYLGHFSAYGLAMVSLAGVVKLRAWATAVILFLLGVGIEFAQPFFGRENHWQDMLANAIGVGTGWLTIVVWRQSLRISD